jgi:hypothetical protein
VQAAQQQVAGQAADLARQAARHAAEVARLEDELAAGQQELGALRQQVGPWPGPEGLACSWPAAGLQLARRWCAAGVGQG